MNCKKKLNKKGQNNLKKNMNDNSNIIQNDARKISEKKNKTNEWPSDEWKDWNTM